jgi:RNA polymerase sigma factor (sigma-70 family)
VTTAALKGDLALVEIDDVADQTSRPPSPGLTDADRVAWAFDAYADDVYRFLVPRCPTPGEAEDLLSIVYLEAWRSRDRMPIEIEMKPWLFGIAKNVVRHQARARRRHRAALDRYTALTATDAPDDVAVEAARHADIDVEAQAVGAALRKLPAHERELAERCLVRGESVAAVAADLHLPESTVRSRVKAVRQHLRSLLRSGEPFADRRSTGHIATDARRASYVRE